MNGADSPYQQHEHQIGVRLSYIVSDPDRAHPKSLHLISYDAYKYRCYRNPGFRLKEGRGAGNEALLRWVSLPRGWREALEERFGGPEKSYSPLAKHFSLSGEAREFYNKYQREDGEYLKPKYQNRYTVNASVLEAVEGLRVERRAMRKARQGSLQGLWDSLAGDVAAFQVHLKGMGLCGHTLPGSAKRLRMWYKRYFEKRGGRNYASLIDGRLENSNAIIVTPEMISLWMAIYAGQRGYKPNYKEVAVRYGEFLAGKLEVLNNETGELYSPNAECYLPASESTVYNYQNVWENKVASHFRRSGNRQVFKGIYDPYHKLGAPAYAGSVLSIDDRQPPFVYLQGKKKQRTWWYMGIDLGSNAWTCWVHGESKEGLIENFYRQLARNYFAWDKPVPYELECEMSLNSAYQATLLAPGAMFQKVRIEANNARGKRIERSFGKMRYEREKKMAGWMPRPHARREDNQLPAEKIPVLERSEIVSNVLRNIESWNNELHPDQELHPGMTCWDVFLDKQHPDIRPTNWQGILPHIGYEQASSMRAGRIALQGKHRVVGLNGTPLRGEKLLHVMRQVEGQTVTVRWLDDHEGRVMKAMVYTREGTYVSELLSDHEYGGDLEYSRSVLERTDEDLVRRELMSAYAKTVQAYISRSAGAIERVTLLEKPAAPVAKRFAISGTRTYTPKKAEPLPRPEAPVPEPSYANSFKLRTSDRF